MNVSHRSMETIRRKDPVHLRLTSCASPSISRLARPPIESTAPPATNHSNLHFHKGSVKRLQNLPSALARALSKILSPPTNPSPAMRLASESHLGLGSVKVLNSTSTNSLTDLDATINQSTPHRVARHPLGRQTTSFEANAMRIKA